LLDLNHTEVEKGRGFPKITKLRKTQPLTTTPVYVLRVALKVCLKIYPEGNVF